MSDLVSQVHLNKATRGPRLAAIVCDCGVINKTKNGDFEWQVSEQQKNKNKIPNNKVRLIHPKQKDQQVHLMGKELNSGQAFYCLCNSFIPFCKV